MFLVTSGRESAAETVIFSEELSQSTRPALIKTVTENEVKEKGTLFSPGGKRNYSDNPDGVAKRKEKIENESLFSRL